MKRIIACLMAGILMLALVGCGTSGSSSAAAKKDYTQILHDARSDEDNEYLMIFTKGEDGKFTAQYGYSAEYEADQLSDEVANMMMPLLGLEDGMYDDFAASTAWPSSSPQRAGRRTSSMRWMPTSRASRRRWSGIWRTSTRSPAQPGS